MTISSNQILNVFSLLLCLLSLELCGRLVLAPWLDLMDFAYGLLFGLTNSSLSLRQTLLNLLLISSLLLFFLVPHFLSFSHTCSSFLLVPVIRIFLDLHWMPHFLSFPYSGSSFLLSLIFLAFFNLDRMPDFLCLSYTCSTFLLPLIFFTFFETFVLLYSVCVER